MFRKCVFGDAASDLGQADFAVIGLPFDSTTHFRSGSREGPDAIRRASQSLENYDYYYNIDLADLSICDLGNMELGTNPSIACEAVREVVIDLPERAIPICLGGEHSITPPIVEALADQGDLGIIVLDAHLDLRDEYGGTKLSHACASRRILEIEEVCSFASLGIRSGSRDEFVFAKENDVLYFTSDAIHEKGIDKVLDLALESLDSERIYISIDIDALDPAYAPGTGSPEPFGLSPWDIRQIMKRFAQKIVGLDVNEVNPTYDNGQTAILAAKLASEFMAAKAVGKKE
jgi:agmatinase